MDYIIRNVNENDSSILRKLAYECKPLDVHTPYTYWVITKIYSNSSFIMIKEGVPIGFITAVYNDEKFLIWQIGLQKEYRRKGLSYKLIESVVSVARDKHFNEILVSIDATNSCSYKSFSNYCKKNQLTFDAIGQVQLKDYLDLDFSENEILYKIELKS